jgi:hypothetical protein
MSVSEIFEKSTPIEVEGVCGEKMIARTISKVVEYRCPRLRSPRYALGILYVQDPQGSARIACEMCPIRRNAGLKNIPKSENQVTPTETKNCSNCETICDSPGGMDCRWL